MEAMIRSGRPRKVWRVARGNTVLRGYAVRTEGAVKSEQSDRPMSIGGGAHLALVTEGPVSVDLGGTWQVI